MVTASAAKCLHQQLALLGEVAVKVISWAGITCDLETEMLILIMYLKKYLKIFEKVKYFRKVFKYKYISFLKVKYKYFEKVFKYLQIQTYLTPCLRFPHVECNLKSQ